MTTLKAIVRSGRLVLDVPTTLPEGTIVDLAPVDDQAPESAYEPVSVRELELISQQLSMRELAAQEVTEISGPPRMTGPPAIEESSFFISPRAPARSVIARRHLATLSERRLAPIEGTEAAAQVREAGARATTHLRQLEASPDGDNYLANAKAALTSAQRLLSLLQAAATTRPELLPAVEEAAEAVGLIFSLLS